MRRHDIYHNETEAQFLSLHSSLSCALSYPRLGLFLEPESQDEKHIEQVPQYL